MYGKLKSLNKGTIKSLSSYKAHSFYFTCNLQMIIHLHFKNIYKLALLSVVLYYYAYKCVIIFPESIL